MKYTWEFKNCVEEYLKGKYFEKSEYANCSYETFKSKIRIWV